MSFGAAKSAWQRSLQIIAMWMIVICIHRVPTTSSTPRYYYRKTISLSESVLVKTVYSVVPMVCVMLLWDIFSGMNLLLIITTTK